VALALQTNYVNVFSLARAKIDMIQTGHRSGKYPAPRSFADRVLCNAPSQPENDDVMCLKSTLKLLSVTVAQFHDPNLLEATNRLGTKSLRLSNQNLQTGRHSS